MNLYGDNRAAQSVLYVEDQPVNVLLMRALFERRPNLRLVVAGSLAEAMQHAQGLYPALLLLDLRLPDGDGRDLLPSLRQIPGCESVHAVAVTAEMDFLLQESAFDELWRKPMDMQQILWRLDELIRLPEQPHEAHHDQQAAPAAWMLDRPQRPQHPQHPQHPHDQGMATR
jgi:CheY-like chemotaxis protein